jgi:hypothetical protein
MNKTSPTKTVEVKYPYEVTLVLAHKQHSMSRHEWTFTHNGLNKKVSSKDVRYYCLDWKSVFESFNPDEIDSVTIKPQRI